MADERVQRKLAAILAADVVGFSRIMGEDEAGTLAQLKTLRREIFEPKTALFGQNRRARVSGIYFGLPT